MKAEAILTELLNMCDTPMFCKNSKGIILHANPAFAHLAGFTADSVSGLAADALFDGQLQKTDRETDGQLQKGAEKIEYDADIIIGGIARKYRFMKMRVSFSKRKHAIVCAMKERTASDILDSFLDQLFLVVEYSPVSIVITDTEGTIQYVNQTFTKVTGYSKEEAIGKNPRILKSGVQPKDFYTKLWETIKSGNSWQGEFHNINKQGEPFWEIASISPLFDINGNITNFVAIKENISYLKNIQDELRKSEERNREILEAIPDIMVRLNNRAEILDQNLKEKIDEVLPESERANARVYIEHSLQTGAMQVYEYPVVRDGDEQYYEARFIVSGEDEVLTIIRNITERIRAEQQIKAAREVAENANRAKSAFLATMSHEIRTPLHSISGFIELLKKTPLNESQKEYLSIIAQSADNLLEIINDVLDFSKIESGKMDIENITFDPFKEFESVFELFAKRAQSKKISLYPYIDPLLPRSIVSDPLRIRQVLFNLLGNAIKFTPQGGKIFVEIKSAGKSERTLNISFSVRDTGIGIPPHKKEKIFESFTQADSSVTRKYGGTGLGLSISRNLVHLLGGNLDLESAPGKGSTFSFVIPVQKSTQEKESALPIRTVAYIYSPEPSDPDLSQLLLRYLSSFKMKAKIVSSVAEVSGTEKIVFFIEPPDVKYDIHSLIATTQEKSIPIILIKPQGTSQTSQELPETTKVLFPPISASKLFNCIIETLDLHHFIKKAESSIESRRHRRFFGNVLVAEDNQVNQKLIKLMLEGYGLSVELVSNGLDAYYRYQEKSFDLIFMDINMPVTDGQEATRMIRQHENENARPPVPIIALTAQALKGDRERFLESGMNGYLTKPIEINKLEETLGAIFPSHESEAGEFSSITPAASPDKKVSFDLESTAKALGIGTAPLRNIIREFLSSSTDFIEEFQSALGNGNAAAIQRTAHRLKGSAANLRFTAIAEIAEKMERDAKSGKIEDASSDIEKIKMLFRAYHEIF